MVRLAWRTWVVALACSALPVAGWAAGLALKQNATLGEIAQALDGPGLQIRNLQVTKGKVGQYGTFSGGIAAVGAGPTLGIANGIYLSTGGVLAVQGANDSPKTSIGTGSSFADPDLTKLSPKAMFDPVIIEFDIVPVGDKLNFVLVFGSEEYPEYVCSRYNDAFGLFVSGPGWQGTRNAAFLPGTHHAITVNQVNGGQAGSNADGTACVLDNTAFFQDNGNGTGNANTQLDGFTKPLTTAVTGLQSGASYHVKLALADAIDPAYDSAALFRWLTSTVAQPLDMEMAVAATKTAVKQHEPFTLTYTLYNRVDKENKDVQVQLHWPPGWEVQGHDAGEAYQPGNAVWYTGNVPPNGSKSITFTVVATQAGSFQPQAEVLYALHDDPDSTPFNSHTFPQEDDTAQLAVTVVEQPVLPLRVKLLLQGAYDSGSGLMRDSLRQQGLLPTRQPYGDAKLLGYAGTEEAVPARFMVAGNDAPVDWVVVELRDPVDPKRVVARQAALLQRDGDVMGAATGDGVLRFAGVSAGNHYVAVRHRNHLGVRTAQALELGGNAALVDFTQPGTAVAGAHARLLRDGRALLWAGDVNANNSIIGVGVGNDINPLLGGVLKAAANVSGSNNYRLAGYQAGDVNMDGILVYSGPGNDTNTVLGNILRHPGNAAGAANFVAQGGI